MPSEGRIHVPGSCSVSARIQSTTREQLHLIARSEGKGLSAYLRDLYGREVVRVLNTSSDSDLVCRLKDLADSARSERLDMISGSHAA